MGDKSTNIKCYVTYLCDLVIIDSVAYKSVINWNNENEKNETNPT